jgi:ATP-dependent Lon protease
MDMTDFDPQPLLQVMADAIIADYGRQAGVRIAERAISRLARLEDEENLQIWLNVHELLHDQPIFNKVAHTLH